MPYAYLGVDDNGHLTTIKRTWSRIREAADLHDLRHKIVSWEVSRRPESAEQATSKHFGS